MPHDRTPLPDQIGRNLPGVEQEDGDDLPIWKSALKPLVSLLETISEIPGVKPVYRKTLKPLLEESEQFSLRTYGTASAEVMAHKAAIQEQGWGGWAASQLNPWDEGIVKAKFNQIVGLDGYQSLKKQLELTEQWQRNRKSAWVGEKFIGEVLTDPLNFIPIGKGAQLIGKAGKVARRTPEQLEQAKRLEVLNLGDMHVVNPAGQWSVDAATLGFDENAVRSLATGTVKRLEKTPVSFLQYPLQWTNPSGLLRYTDPDVTVMGKIRTILLGRQMLRANSLINGDLAAGKVIEMEGPFTYINKKLKGVEQQYVTNVRRKSAVAGETEDILMGEVKEFPDRFILSDAQKELFDEGERLIAGARKAALNAGIRIEDTVLAPDQHYAPRFLLMYAKFIKDDTARIGRAIGETPSIMQARFYDEFGEGAINGVPYFVGKTSTPYMDSIHSYMNMIAKQIIDTAYLDDIASMTGQDVFNIRKLQAIGPGSLRGTIKELEERGEILQRARKTVDEWRGGGMTPTGTLFKELDTLDGGAYLNKELRRIVNPYTRNEAGQRVHRADPTRLAKDRMTNAEKLANVEYQQALDSDLISFRRTLANLRSEADTALRQQRSELKHVEDAVEFRKLQGDVPLPSKMFVEPEFNEMLFKSDFVKAIMPVLASKEEVFRQSKRLQQIPGGPVIASRVLGGAAEFGRTARAMQLTYDLGTQFLQGLMVLPNAPKSWWRAFRKSLESWNNPAKREEYLRDNIEALQMSGGRIHIGSTGFTSGYRAGGTINKVIGSSPIAGRLTDKFQAGFDTFGDVARLEMFKVFMPAIKAGRVSIDDVSNHINKMTGITSSRALGIGATQRELESAMISLAPQYLRSTTALMADAIQILTPHVKRGGKFFGWDVQARFESKQAVYALTRFFGATVLAYVSISYALGQPLRLDPRKKSEGGDGAHFMSMIIDGQVVGLGSKPYSIARKTIAAAMAFEQDKPREAFAHLWSFFRAQTAPLTSTMIDNITGENFIHEPVQTFGERLTNVSSRLLPFWVEAAILDDPKPSGFGTTSDFMGLRGWPLDYKDIINQLGEELVSRLPAYILDDFLDETQKKKMAKGYMKAPTWDMLSKVQKRKIERGELPGLNKAKVKELQRIREAMEKDALRTGPTKFRAYIQEYTRHQTWLEIETEKLQIAYEEGQLSPRDVRFSIKGLNAIYGNKLEELHADDGPHEEYLQELETRRQEKQIRGEEVPLGDLARQDYIRTIIAANDLDDYHGADGYNFELREIREDRLRRLYGDELIDDIELDFILNKGVGMLYKQLQLDKRNELRSYWDVQNSYIDKNPRVGSLLKLESQAESEGNAPLLQQIRATLLYKTYNKTTRRDKLELLNRDPRTNAMLVFWGYLTTLHTKEAELILNELKRKAKAGILRQ